MTFDFPPLIDMPPHSLPAQTALQVAQQAIQRLATWAKVELVEEYPELSDAIDRVLKLLFGQVNLLEGKEQQTEHTEN